MRYGQKDICYCGKKIRWQGRYWEHIEGSFRHIAKPVKKGSKMKKSIERSFKLTLELNMDEVRWLKDLVQNPPEEETLIHRGYRQDLWNATSEALVGGDET